MTNDYRIQKERVTVTLVTFDGEHIVGDLFVQPSARNRYGREEAPDVMNAPEPFFPLLTESGETYLVAKDRVREVAVGQALERGEEWVAAPPAIIEVSLVGGERRTGTVYLEALTGRGRVIDFLNRFDERFLTLHTPDGATLANRQAIERIRPVD
jgi:hypothetical protein